MTTATSLGTQITSGARTPGPGPLAGSVVAVPVETCAQPAVIVTVTASSSAAPAPAPVLPCRAQKPLPAEPLFIVTPG
jgi:hypothetical protein